VRPFLRQRRPVNFHKADIIRACIETQLPQPISIQRLGGFFPHRSLPVRFHRGMLFEWSGLPTYAGRNSTDQCCVVF
jgi:hypothetical protein